MMWFGRKKTALQVPKIDTSIDKKDPSKAIESRLKNNRWLTRKQTKQLWRATIGTGTVEIDSGLLDDVLNLLLIYEIYAPNVADCGFVESYDELFEAGEMTDPPLDESHVEVEYATSEEITQIEAAVNTPDTEPVKIENDTRSSMQSDPGGYGAGGFDSGDSDGGFGD